MEFTELTSCYFTIISIADYSSHRGPVGKRFYFHIYTKSCWHAYSIIPITINSMIRCCARSLVLFWHMLPPRCGPAAAPQQWKEDY